MVYYCYTHITHWKSTLIADTRLIGWFVLSMAIFLGLAHATGCVGHLKKHALGVQGKAVGMTGERYAVHDPVSTWDVMKPVWFSGVGNMPLRCAILVQHQKAKFHWAIVCHYCAISGWQNATWLFCATSVWHATCPPFATFVDKVLVLFGQGPRIVRSSSAYLPSKLTTRGVFD